MGERVASSVLTAGIDLAAESSTTALALLRWQRGVARVESLRVGVNDGDLLAALSESDCSGVDVPFGWPIAFLTLLQEHAGGSITIPRPQDSLWRDSVCFRETDREVRRIQGIRPLSVAADKIGRVSIRAAALLASMEAQGQPVDRAGGGRVIEIYPAAALKHWGLSYSRYKSAKGRTLLESLVTGLLRLAPWLDLGEHDALCRKSADAFDAVIAALVARAHALGYGTLPTDAQVQAARVEGWIVLPTCALSDLA